MRAPSRLRLTVAGLAVGGVLAGSGLTAGAAQAQAPDPFGFGGGSGSSFDFGGGSTGGSPGGSFDFGLTAPLPPSTTGGSGSGGSGSLTDILKDIGKRAAEDLGKEALNRLLNRNRENNNSAAQPGTTQQQGQQQGQQGTGLPGTAEDGSLTRQLPSTTGAGRRVPEPIEKILREAGINITDWVLKRQPGNRRTGFGTFKAPERYFRPELQRQSCRIPGNVRLFGTTVGRGRFTPANFIGGDNLGRTLVLGRNSFLAPSGDKLLRFSTVNFVFLSRRDAEVLRPQPRVAKNTVLEDRVRYSTDFLERGVKYTVLVRYTNTCNEPVVDVLGKVRRR